MAIENLGFQVRYNAGPQLRLEYDASFRSDIEVNASGDVSVSPTSGKMGLTGVAGQTLLELTAGAINEDAVIQAVVTGTGVFQAKSDGGFELECNSALALQADEDGILPGAGLITGNARLSSSSSGNSVLFTASSAAKAYWIFTPGGTSASPSTGHSPEIRIYPHSFNATSPNGFYLYLLYNGTNFELGYTADGGSIPTELEFDTIIEPNQVRVGSSGSASSPSYSFASDTNTGFFLGGLDIVDFSAGGTRRMRFWSTGLYMYSGVIRNTSGSAAAPSYAFASAADTGMYYAAGPTLGISVDGSDAFNITTSRINCGTRLEIDRGTGSTALGLNFEGHTNTGMWYDNASDIWTFTINGVDFLEMSESAGLNIFTFTTNWSQGFNFVRSSAGSSEIRMSTSEGQFLSFGGDAGLGTEEAYIDAADGPLRLQVASVDIMTLATAEVNVFQNTRFDESQAIFHFGTVDVGTIEATSITDFKFVSPTGVTQTFTIGSTDVLTLTESAVTYGTALEATRFRATSGTTALPAFSFSGDTDTGIDLPLAGIMYFISAGNIVIIMQGSIVQFNEDIRTPSGNAISPGCQIGAANDGFFRPASSVIGASVGGNEVWRWTATGAETSQPILAEDGSLSDPSYSFQNETGLGIGRSNPGELAVISSSLVRFAVSSSDARFTVEVRFPQGSAADPSIVFTNRTTTGFYCVPGATAGDAEVHLAINGVDQGAIGPPGAFTQHTETTLAFFSGTAVSQQSTPSNPSITTISGSGDDLNINNNFSSLETAVNALISVLASYDLTV